VAKKIPVKTAAPIAPIIIPIFSKIAGAV